MNDVMVVSIVIICAVVITRCGSNDRQLLIVVLHVTPSSLLLGWCRGYRDVPTLVMSHGKVEDIHRGSKGSCLKCMP